MVLPGAKHLNTFNAVPPEIYPMTPEPASAGTVGITALFIALLGPLAGEYAAIVFAALAGSLWPLSNSDTMTPRHGFALVLRLVLTASILTSLIAWVLETKYGITARITLTPVAFAIGVIGDGWRGIFRQAKSFLVDRFLSRQGVAPAPTPDLVTPKKEDNQ